MTLKISLIILFIITRISADVVKVSTEKKERFMIKEHKSGKWSPELTEQEKATLFNIAEDTLQWCVTGKKKDFDFSKYEITEKLKVKTATFVTLKENHHLRGCIGSLMPVAPLYRSIHDNAINAALRDHRFMPVTEYELPGIEIHLSILSPIEEIKSLDDFHPGEHGIIIEKGYHSAVFLPEVAIEQHWTKTDTLEALSEKAGMDKDAWKEGTKYFIFSSVALSKE